MASWPPLALALGAALAMTTLVWVASLVKRDASIIDVFWGPGFVVLGVVYFVVAEAHAPRAAPGRRPGDALGPAPLRLHPVAQLGPGRGLPLP